MYLYILKSESTGRYYVGITVALPTRVAQHNSPQSNPSRWTRGGGSWRLVFRREFGTAAEALRAERYIKRMKSRAFVEKLISADYQLPDLKN